MKIIKLGPEAKTTQHVGFLLTEVNGRNIT